MTMNVQEQLQADLKTALRAKDVDAKRTIRLAMAAIKNERVAKNADLTPEEMITILQKLAKQWQDAILEYKKADRQDLVSETEVEVAFLKRYLPAMLTREEVEAMTREAIAETGASNPKQMGAVMRVLMPRLQGRADGRLVSQVVRELLA